MAIDYWHRYEEGGCYHLYNRCISEVNLFEFPGMCDHFIIKIKKYLSPFMVLYGYCLMPNHFHLLVRIKNHDAIQDASLDWNESNRLRQYDKGACDLNSLIEDQTRRLFSSLVMFYNKINKRRGSIFTERMKRILQRSEFNILDQLCYIHHNPIHHGFTLNYESWEYSSYNSYARRSFLFQGQREFIMQFFNNVNAQSIEEFIKVHEDYKVDKAEESFTEF